MLTVNFKNIRGFTLIELLVVIAIIGILASVVLASLTSARTKATDVAIKAEVRNFAQLLQLNASDYNSFAELQSGWDSSAADCANSFTGNHAAKARELCASIVGKIGAGNNLFHTGVSYVSDRTNITHYAIMAWLPGAQRFYCMGSSGAVSATTPNETAYWVGAGCFGNP